MNNKKSFPAKVEKHELILLYLYYSFICFFAICISVMVIASNNLNLSLFPPEFNFFLYGSFTVNTSSKLNVYNLAFLGSMSSALLGASITYIKKLYVFSLGNIFDLDVNGEKDTVTKLGTIIYFLFRPVLQLYFQ